VCSRRQFSTERHRIRFKIKQLSSDEWISIGIMPTKSSTPCILQDNPTIYGQIERHGAFFNGVHLCCNAYDNSKGTNDEVELFVDCDRHIIYLTNGQMDETRKIDVDLVKYPFPWQFSVILYKPDDCVCSFLT
jgi:hypothetical protein